MSDTDGAEHAAYFDTIDDSFEFFSPPRKITVDFVAKDADEAEAPTFPQTPLRGFLIDEDDFITNVSKIEADPLKHFRPDEVGIEPDASTSDRADLESEERHEHMVRRARILTVVIALGGALLWRFDSGKNVLRLIALLLPGKERTEWLEEQRGYLADLSDRRGRWAWIARQIIAMPRYAYTVRTGGEREPA
ncbi:hypothetical protein GCM10009548_36030 [Streptomyces malaysiensis subsp. malaysiensis]|uniref:Uncharacterized protein n=1 Tax=Streptomyces malaysiensis TaxID=92644 RepID=A0ABX6WBM2_STRMQ|nr:MULTISPECIES: hypothetical protein [Streptomyces]QPI58839.1 hypothetical protein I1A49_31600 [Streptomyces solisilvae]UHH20468.1 hypothetical protein LUV23_31800 [Streptomyces sp. HNM0561]